MVENHESNKLNLVSDKFAFSYMDIQMLRIYIVYDRCSTLAGECISSCVSLQEI